MVRAAFDAFNRMGDWESTLADAAPDFEFDMSRSIAPMRGVYSLEETPKLLNELIAGFESVRIEPHEFIELDEHVIVPLTAHMVGRDGIEVEARTTWTWKVRNGAVERVCLYQTREEALEGVGSAQ